MTPTLSVEADHVRLIWDDETALAVRPVGVEGGVVSEAAGVLALAAVDWAEAFPAASMATTV